VQTCDLADGPQQRHVRIRIERSALAVQEKSRRHDVSEQFEQESSSRRSYSSLKKKSRMRFISL
jgi:hypothetical protein